MQKVLYADLYMSCYVYGFIKFAIIAVAMNGVTYVCGVIRLLLWVCNFFQ